MNKYKVVISGVISPVVVESNDCYILQATGDLCFDDGEDNLLYAFHDWERVSKVVE